MNQSQIRKRNNSVPEEPTQSQIYQQQIEEQKNLLRIRYIQQLQEQQEQIQKEEQKNPSGINLNKKRTHYRVDGEVIESVIQSNIEQDQFKNSSISKQNQSRLEQLQQSRELQNNQFQSENSSEIKVLIFQIYFACQAISFIRKHEEEQRKLEEQFLSQIRKEQSMIRANKHQQSQQSIIQSVLPLRQKVKKQCPFCTSDIDEDSFELHLNTCSQRPIQCEYCADSYPFELIDEHKDCCPMKQNHDQIIKQLSMPDMGQLPHQQMEQIPLRQQFIQQEQLNRQQQNQQHRQQVQQQQNSRVMPYNQRNQQANRIVENQIPQQAVNQVRSSSQNRQQSNNGQPNGLINQFFRQIGNIFTTKRRPRARGPKDLIVIKFKNARNLSPSNKMCSICQSDFVEDEQLKLLGCFHRYHKECIDSWLKRSEICPVCRTSAYDL